MKMFLVFLLLLFSRASGFLQNGSVCSTDSLYNLSSCFTFFNHRLNWSQAQDICQQHGLHLITIRNFKEASAIAAFVKNYQQKENIWIKLEKHSQNTQWKITHQSGNGQDNPLQDQEVTVKQNVCVELIATEEFLKWNNTDCQERRPFLCQTLPYHSEFLLNQSEVTKLSKVTESNEKNEDNKLTKYDGGKREKYTSKEDTKTKETLCTNNRSSQKSLTPFLMSSLVFTSFLISLFPKIKSPKQDLQT